MTLMEQSVMAYIQHSFQNSRETMMVLAQGFSQGQHCSGSPSQVHFRSNQNKENRTTVHKISRNNIIQLCIKWRPCSPIKNLCSKETDHNANFTLMHFKTLTTLSKGRHNQTANHRSVSWYSRKLEQIGIKHELPRVWRRSGSAY